MAFEDYLLSLPKKIDFIYYTAGSGGEFLSSLVALSCPKTRTVINQTNLTLDPNHTDRYNMPNYFSRSLLICLEHIDFGSYMMTSEEIIRNTKSSIYASIMFHYSKQFKKLMHKWDPYKEEATTIKNKLEEVYKDIIIIVPKHFYRMNENKLADFNSTKIWNVINIDPITKEGQRCVDNSWRYIFSHSDVREYRDAITSIESFPFFDYLIYEDYNEIKYFLENRYGSNLDFDFIDKSLKDYYKMRVEPHK